MSAIRWGAVDADAHRTFWQRQALVADPGERGIHGKAKAIVVGRHHERATTDRCRTEANVEARKKRPTAVHQVPHTLLGLKTQAPQVRQREGARAPQKPSGRRAVTLGLHAEINRVGAPWASGDGEGDRALKPRQ